MTGEHDPKNAAPPIGMAAWLLAGGTLVDRMDWLIANGFEGVSILQSITECDAAERAEAAAAIAQANLTVTYHGNVHHKLTASGELDVDFTRRMCDDVIWWHENAGAVQSCCSDPIHAVDADGQAAFSMDMNRRHMQMLADALGPRGIRAGIENGFGGAERFRSLDDIARFRAACSPVDIGLLLDAGHANIHVRSDGIDGESEIGHYVTQLPLEILEVHFSDNLGHRDEHKQLGYGNGDLPALLAALKRRHFAGAFTIEVCVDILSGRYGADIHNPAQTDPILISRDRLAAAWRALD